LDIRDILFYLCFIKSSNGLTQMSTELTEGQKYELAIVYGTIFMLSAAIDSIGAVQGILLDRDAKYAINKAKNAEKACNAVLKVLEREKTKYMTAEEKKVSELAVETQKELIYSFFLLEPDQQRRVSGLIKKLKSNEQ